MFLNNGTHDSRKSHRFLLQHLSSRNLSIYVFVVSLTLLKSASMLEENSHLACIQSSPIVRPNESSTDAKTWSYGSVLWCKQQSRSNSQAKKKCRVCLPANPYVPELSLFKHSDVKMSRATAYYRLCPALNLLFIILLFKSSLFISSSLFPIFIFLIMSPFSSSPHLLL